MFDNIKITKSYKIKDSKNEGDIEICAFNAYLDVCSGITQDLNITYPILYKENKKDILQSYREFSAEVDSIAADMGLVYNEEINNSMLSNLKPLTQDFKIMINAIIKDIIKL
ncbi:hypothetical protein [Paraclostridium bifermentans]|uniref:hypothetical protein n=1 Tax=Paraclostridium bifermentans TaxID=1490 RepID=UPI00290847AC|nr:hypothetical protein [Paraclostridium bifermentans]MDU3338209.1 hypothetical protein [Paraclostridium bifermentans]